MAFLDKAGLARFKDRLLAEIQSGGWCKAVAVNSARDRAEGAKNYGLGEDADGFAQQNYGGVRERDTSKPMYGLL